MSLIALADAKAFLDVIHAADDAKLQMLLDGAEEEALRFMNRKTFGGDCGLPGDDDGGVPSLPDGIPSSAKVAVLLLLQASYQAAPEDAAKLRTAAEVKLMPYRCGMGV